MEHDISGPHQEFIFSVLVGALLGVIIILVLKIYPGEPFDYSTEETINRSNATVGNTVAYTKTEEEKVGEILIDENKVMKSQAVQKAKKLFGLSDEDMLQAIRNAREEQAHGRPQEAILGDYGKISGKVDMIFYVVAFSALVYFLERDYGNIVSAFLRTYFPKEAAIIWGRP